MSEDADFATIRKHYENAHLTETILGALHDAGIDVKRLTTDDLAPFDQFHIGGKGATLELMRFANIAPGSRILDAGGGIGGPARTISSNLDCEIVVVDLSESFCQAGTALTELTGFSEKVNFVNGNVLSIPAEDSSFDVVWTQHSSMNIDDKETMYREFHRVLRQGGKLVIHEVVAGPVTPLRFPVPWATSLEASFLRSSDGLLSVITGAGFRKVEFLDVSDEAITFWRQRAAAIANDGVTPRLGLHLLLGPGFAEMGANIMQNLIENRTRVVQALFSKD